MDIVAMVPTYVECRILRRVNRFVVEVEAGGEQVLAHNTNTGRLLDVLVPGRLGLCRPLEKPGKTRYRLFAVEYAGGFAVIDTRLQEEAFARAVELGLIPWLGVAGLPAGGSGLALRCSASCWTVGMEGYTLRLRALC